MTSKSTIALVAAWLLAGCAGNHTLQDGQQLAEQGRLEEAVRRFEAVLRDAPANAEARQALADARRQLAGRWLASAEAAARAGRRGEAEAFIAKAVAADPDNAGVRALAELLGRQRRVEALRAEGEAAWGRGDAATAREQLRNLLAEVPEDPAALRLFQAIEASQAPSPLDARLAAALARPVSIEFKDASVKQVFEVLARTSGINFIFDRDVKADQPVTVYLRNATVKELLAAVLMTNQLEQRALDGGTILIYPNTPAKARDYQPLTVKSFFLVNADAKLAANTLRTILKIRDVLVDEKQNMVVVRDTPEAVRQAEKLLAMHDLPEPEVMLEVEVLEVARSRLTDLGIRWPDQLTLTPLPTVANGLLTLHDIIHGNSRNLGAAISPMVLNLKNENGDTNLLANPRIRTRNRETARILIGNRVPNITTTATATGFVAETVQYVDVGLKLEAQPTIHPNGEVAIRISLEVSNIIDKVQTKSGSLAYQIGTRNAATVLRLRDGENQVLAGLINDEERSTAHKVPGLGDLPVVGRLFGSSRDEAQKTEIVLSITPRLVRSRPAPVRTEFDSGTDVSLRAAGADLAAYTEVVPPPTTPPAPEAR